MDFSEILEMAVGITAAVIGFALIGLFFFMAFPVIGVMLSVVVGVGIVGLLVFIIVAAAVVAVDVFRRAFKAIQDLFS